MTLLSTKTILQECERKGFAVGAFNINSLDQPRALVNKAEDLGSPIIVVFPGFAEKYVHLEDFATLMTSIANNSSVPVSFHLSHASDITQFKRACKAGFKSVMFDGSSLSYEKNVAFTAEAVKFGHQYGCDVEGELGSIASSWVDIHETMTDPNLAEEFVNRTKVDILAISIGNSHGIYKGEPCLDFTRLSEIKNAIRRHNCYVTLHGGSGISSADIQESIKLGVNKICIYTEMCVEGRLRVVNFLNEHQVYSGNQTIPEILDAMLQGFVDVAGKYMCIFLSDGKV